MAYVGAALDVVYAALHSWRIAMVYDAAGHIAAVVQVVDAVRAATGWTTVFNWARVALAVGDCGVVSRWIRLVLVVRILGAAAGFAPCFLGPLCRAAEPWTSIPWRASFLWVNGALRVLASSLLLPLSSFLMGSGVMLLSRAEVLSPSECLSATERRTLEALLSGDVVLGLLAAALGAVRETVVMREAIALHLLPQSGPPRRRRASVVPALVGAAARPPVPWSVAQAAATVANCPICLESLRGRRVLGLACDGAHAFHSTCLRKWLRRKHECPICRAAVA
jgi:hypothetical protein